MRVFFELLYTRLAWTYDFVAWTSSMGQWHSWRRTALEDLPEGRVLELGHGPGHLLVDLQRTRASVYGIDRSRQMSRRAWRRLRVAGSHAGIARASAFELPFARRSFASIVSTFPTEYILDPRTVREVARVLAPGGLMVVIPVAAITGPGIFDRSAGWLNRLTGQSDTAGERWIAPWREGPFDVEVEHIVLPRSRVWRIRARRR
ncbi:MAG: class I SAM-dependent methyltransferase [Anaerolineales bacterium]